MNRCYLNGRAVGIVLGGLVFSANLQADYQVSQIPFSRSDAGTVGLGAGFRSGMSPYKHVKTLASIKTENNSDLIPLYLYEGKYVFFEGTRAGFHLWNDAFKLDAVTQYRFDRLESSVDDFYRTVEDRQQTLESGFSLVIEREWGEVAFNALADVQSRHNGHTFDANYLYPIDMGRWRFGPYISLIYQSSELVDYYYGVDATEARPDLPEYNADSATFARVGVNTSYAISNWLFFANFSFENLPEEIQDSPLVDKDFVTTSLLGFSYQFGNVFAPTSDVVSLPDLKDWSWRIHAGYQADATFHKIHRGDFVRDEVHTYLAGLTLGKLLSNGKKVDYWAKMSFNRRFERGLQDNFWQYDIYAMAMGTGYSPWSNKELFRYGFGFGFSYAERIPTVEQVKQEKRGEYTAHFLNYLEAQLDFPLRNFTRAESVQDCYVGISLIHRSGIFATSDILGNVAGGSDIVAGHLECKR